MFRLMMSAVLLSGAASAHAAPPEVRELAEQVRGGGFDVSLDPVVLERLQRLRHPERQRSVKAALTRSALYEPMLSEKVIASALPGEVVAVAIVESRFLNIEEHLPERPAAGIWQFIPSTARAYGLRVDAQVDERLDPDLSTDAALWLLSDLHREFQDWGLAFAAYNRGSRAVHEAIRREGTQDCWTLIQRGALPPYAADVMAMVLLLEASEPVARE